jgi:hypothetical protein
MNDQDSVALGLLEGASEIAEFVYGDPKRARSVYHLWKTRRAPLFRIGSTICARRTGLRNWLEEQENAARKTEAA